MGSHKLWVLLGVSFVAGLLAAWLAPGNLFVRFVPLVTCGCLAVSMGMLVLVSRYKRTDVTSTERFARRMLFTEAPPT